MSNSIVILKQIVDLLYEDYLKTVSESNAIKSNLSSTETELALKTKELESLLTENIKLTNILSRYEADIEILANIISETPKKTEKTPEVQQQEQQQKQPNVCGRTVIIEQTPVETPKETPVETKVETPLEQEQKKKPRTDYMREYQREYRKKKREEKVSMNI